MYIETGRVKGFGYYTDLTRFGVVTTTASDPNPTDPFFSVLRMEFTTEDDINNIEIQVENTDLL